MMRRFIDYHPLINFILYAVIILISVFSTNPMIILISFLMSIINCAHMKGMQKTFKSLWSLLIVAAMITIINSAFNHQGMTVILFFKNGNALTLESIAFGAYMATMLTAVIFWFESINVVMTSDKFIYLFGRVFPHFSLVLSMTFRFVPRFKERFTQIRNAQKCIGKDLSQGNFIEKIRHFVNEISILISWSMESSIEVADSMKARGYGLEKRTSYSIFRFKKADAVVLIIIAILSAIILMASLKGNITFQFFPFIYGNLFSIKTFAAYVSFAAMCVIPIAVDVKE